MLQVQLRLVGCFLKIFFTISIFCLIFDKKLLNFKIIKNHPIRGKVCYNELSNAIFVANVGNYYAHSELFD